MVCVKVTCVRDSADIFFSLALQCHLLAMRHHCGPGMGWMRCAMIFCAPCGAMRCSTRQPHLSYSHESDDDDIEERYLAAKECSWLWMQLWKTRTIYLDAECMPVKSRHSRSFFIFPKVASTMVMTLPVHSFPKYVNRTQCDWDWALCMLRQAIPDHCVICLACLSTLNQQCRQPKQRIRKLAHRLYTLACWIASQICAKARLFQGESLPSSTTGTQR